MQNRIKEAFIIIMIGLIATTCCLACCAQNNHKKKNITSLKKQSLCVLEETEDRIVYLTKLVRIVQNRGDEKKHNAGGEEFFLRYETLTLSKNDERIGMFNCAILHCKPERIVTPDGQNYDTAAFYILPESSTSCDNNNYEGLIGSERVWTNAGLDGDDGVASKIANYCESHRDLITVYQEDLDYYIDNFW